MGITISHRVRTEICEVARFNSRRFLMERRATVAEAGERINNTKSMNTPSTLSLAYRKQLADLLKKYGTLREKANTVYQSKYSEVEQSLLNDYAEEKLGAQLMSEIAAMQVEVDSLKESLSTIGLELEGKTLTIAWSSPGSLSQRFQEQIERQIGKRSDIEARFENAYLAMMTVPALEDAKKILDSVSDLCK